MNAKRLTSLPPLPSLNIIDMEDFVRRFQFKEREDARKYCQMNPQYEVMAITKFGVTRYGLRDASGAHDPFEVPIGSLDGIERPSHNGKQPRKVKAPGEVRNGIAAPNKGTVGAATWALFDDMWKIRKEPFTKSVLLAAATNHKFNHNNVLTECSRWRKFHGMDWKLS